ncbi:isochorismatase family protein [Beggiatoa leptomitoformis]|uniref:Isochorismatase family protein n=1 Tax=Beggiatoa leptomitoformis TaxID=288004 RepID=A0A650GDB7_9GAMM|nr:isochorismatase family protein [Beggiatoa leptomitoformis]QGX03846.1 isochorismatase family protein [Beggiatoa leptomitoformis]QGX04143.1 isochorismatase family protein [Beggiatoa leptomitoformis]
MPYLTLKLSKKLPVAVKAQLASELTRLMAEILCKEARLTAITIEELENSSWFIGGEIQDIGAYLAINITQNTNTATQKAQMLQAASALLQTHLGQLPLATYIVINEISADSWGYDGATQASRKNSVVSGNYANPPTGGKKRALLVIDVQNEYFTGKLPVSYPSNAQANLLRAITFAQQADIAVVFIQHTLEKGLSVFQKDSIGWELHPSIAAITPDFYIEKTQPSSFVHTGLENYLRSNGIDTVVISGYMTQMCCDTTARYAFHLGFNVEFLSDATATLGFENTAGKVTAETLHNTVLVVQASRFSQVLSVDEWIASVSQ